MRYAAWGMAVRAAWEGVAALFLALAWLWLAAGMSIGWLDDAWKVLVTGAALSTGALYQARRLAARRDVQRWEERLGEERAARELDAGRAERSRRAEREEKVMLRYAGPPRDVTLTCEELTAAHRALADGQPVPVLTWHQPGWVPCAYCGGPVEPYRLGEGRFACSKHL